MEKKLPDSYVVNRRLKTYPTEIGSLNFKVDDIELFKINKTSKLKNFYNQKFEEIKKEYISLMNDIEVNERLYKCKYSFEPIVGQTYHLYLKDDGTEFLSIISPEEWKNKSLIGSYLYDSDGRWVEKYLRT
jgi:hypothetical protein